MTRKIISPPPRQDDAPSSNRRTIQSYELIARSYAEDTAPDPACPIRCR